MMSREAADPTRAGTRAAVRRGAGVARHSALMLAGALSGTLIGPLLIVAAIVTLPFERLQALLLRAELGRLAVFFRDESRASRELKPRMSYLLLQGVLATAAGICVFVLVSSGLLMGVGAAIDLLSGGHDMVILRFPGISLRQNQALVGISYAIFMAAVATGLVALLHTLQLRLLTWVYGPSPSDRLQARIVELTESRSGIVQAVDDERRRIERDLHDGVQQRTVALSLLLGRVRRAGETDKSAELLQQAQSQAQDLIDEMRQVAWRIYPTALDQLGLDKALAAVAESAALAVSVHNRLDVKLSQPIETAIYFVVREAITNAAKHSGAASATVVLEDVSDRPTCRPLDDRGRKVVAQIQDDGKGGADPDGAGLRGLARRAAAFDGVLNVYSPQGGPTLISLEIPCE